MKRNTSQADLEILGSKRIGVKEFDFLGVTLRYQSRDHFIPRRPFPIGGPLEPSIYFLTVSEIFNGERYAMVDMTLNDL